MIIKDVNDQKRGGKTWDWERIIANKFIVLYINKV